MKSQWKKKKEEEAKFANEAKKIYKKNRWLEEIEEDGKGQPNIVTREKKKERKTDVKKENTIK